jgi:protein-L-isoaspartate(D-aspartate) O-methyltransferase
MDWEHARYLMVEQQIRTWDVLDLDILNQLYQLKRENFVPADKREMAFVDMMLPLGVGDAMMLHPKMEARIVQETLPQENEKVLVVGAGSGYLVALMAAFSKEVYSLEILPELVDMAKTNLARAGVSNATVLLGDGNQGLEKEGPFDIIVVTASMPELSEALKKQLAINGRLFVVVGDAPDMRAMLVTRTAEDQWTEVAIFETYLPVLVNARQPARFAF